MNRKSKPELTYADNPEWTNADVARATPFGQLPASLQATLTGRRRGPQKAPTKVRTSLRLSPAVVEYFKGTGAGWQTRIDASLLQLIAKPAVHASPGKSIAKRVVRKTASAKRGASHRKGGKRARDNARL